MPVVVHPTVLPPAQLGVAYDAALGAAGGTGPYTFAVQSGALPTGLSLVGDLITGTPTVVGVFTFTIRATDTLAAVGDQAFSVTTTGQAALAIIVEDGTTIANSNSYLSLADALSLQTLQGFGLYNNTAFTLLTPTQQSQLLIFGTQYLDRRFRFYGNTVEADQSLQWPRTKNYDDRGRVIAAGTIPTQLKKALAMLVVQAAEDPSLQDPETSDSTGNASSWSTDGLSVDFEKKETSKGSEDMLATAKLFETSLPDVEVILRSIGEALPGDWLGPNRQTVVV